MEVFYWVNISLNQGSFKKYKNVFLSLVENMYYKTKTDNT